MNLFKIDDICNECKEKYQPKIIYEVIPISQGILEYYYLYDEIILNQKQKDYLSKHLHLLYEYILNKSSNLVLWINLDNINEVKKSLKYILGFRKIAFMSLLRMNFEDCVVFY